MTPDEQEAHSLKYNLQRITRLSSGRFAVFGPHSNEAGIPLLWIGTWAELEPFVIAPENPVYLPPAAIDLSALMAARLPAQPALKRRF